MLYAKPEGKVLKIIRGKMNLRCVSNMQIIFSLILFKYGQQQIIEIQKKKVHKQKDVLFYKSKITNKNFLFFNCKILYFC